MDFNIDELLKLDCSCKKEWETEVLQPFLARNRTLVGVLILLAVVSTLGITSILSAIWPAGLIWLIVLVKGRKPWGYSGVILFAALGSIEEFLYLAIRGAGNVDAVYVSIWQVTLVIAGLLAYSLRRELYPYAGLFGPRKDENGDPIIVRELTE